MQDLNLDEIIRAWHHRNQINSPLKLGSICIRAIQLLAGGRPVSVEQLAAVSHLPLETVNDSFNQLKMSGAEFDNQGNLVGAILSLKPTSHRFRVNGRQLFAWCALDTLFLPALLQQPAQVESLCPTTSINIRLTVTPEGIESLNPASTVISVVVPGVTPSCELEAKSGPQGPVCSPMHFFSYREAASTWLVANPGMAILSIDEAWQLAREVWIEPQQTQDSL